jgi:hypothetical protein
MAEVTNEGLAYIALLREAKGNERAISFESATGKEAAVGDEITTHGKKWRIVAIEPEEPPWAGTLVCEPADEVVNSSDPSRLEHDLPLHLRVVRMILEGEPTRERIDQAVALATEVYELEAYGEFED